ncbi:MAG: phosphoribosylformylglycinamidine synthase subunit PurQ [Chitinophagaceae bacterium]
MKFANSGGKVLGICNGFQILCESGLLPGVLLRNANMQFVCKNVFITDKNENPKQCYKIPVAHGEGRYYADENNIERSRMHNKQIFISLL